MNSKLQNMFSLYKGSGRKTTNSNCDIILSILQEPLPTTPVLLDFRNLNTNSSVIELSSRTYYDAKYRKLMFFNFYFELFFSTKINYLMLFHWYDLKIKFSIAEN